MFLILCAGCLPEERPSELDTLIAARHAHDQALWDARHAARKDGRIKIGMTVEKFIEVWTKGDNYSPDISESVTAGHRIETIEFWDMTKQLGYMRYRTLIFTFDNGILESRHEF